MNKPQQMEKKSFNLLQKFWSLPAYRDDNFWNNIVNIV